MSEKMRLGRGMQRARKRSILTSAAEHTPGIETIIETTKNAGQKAKEAVMNATFWTLARTGVYGATGLALDAALTSTTDMDAPGRWATIGVGVAGLEGLGRYAKRKLRENNTLKDLALRGYTAATGTAATLTALTASTGELTPQRLGKTALLAGASAAAYKLAKPVRTGVSTLLETPGRRKAGLTTLAALTLAAGAADRQNLPGYLEHLPSGAPAAELVRTASTATDEIAQRIKYMGHADVDLNEEGIEHALAGHDLPAHLETYIANNAEHALRAELTHGTPAEALLAMAVSEHSGDADNPLIAKAQNHFGIKAYGNAPAELLWTTEIIDGKPVSRQEPFRKYDDAQDSYHDAARLLSTSPLYEAAQNATTPGAFLEGTERWSTDPAAVQRRKNVLNQYRFSRILADVRAANDLPMPGAPHITAAR